MPNKQYVIILPPRGPRSEDQSNVKQSALKMTNTVFRRVGKIAQSDC